MMLACRTGTHRFLGPRTHGERAHIPEKNTHSYTFRLGQNNIQHLFTCLPWLDQVVCVLCMHIVHIRQMHSGNAVVVKNSTTRTIALPATPQHVFALEEQCRRTMWQRIRNTGSRKFHFGVATRRKEHMFALSSCGFLRRTATILTWKATHLPVGINTHPRANSKQHPI